ncbi:hypothetical protein [Amycolatopsis thermophila]|uniref:Uncharacterized protein n=1 Tax=Amycolatopsis thermophila TaxID=206084 RepID=A0ABU0EMS1_9PSEU|nr:hypothetical protein [Amycolatopsis thermophila]MDQ0376578.1 hypothetical protein [Amycolatopsis thermophila]
MWLDDDFGEYPKPREGFERARAGTPTLLHEVSAKVGLVDEDFATVAAWARSAGGAAA